MKSGDYYNLHTLRKTMSGRSPWSRLITAATRIRMGENEEKVLAEYGYVKGLESECKRVLERKP